MKNCSINFAVSTFPTKNLLGIHFHQINQNLPNSGKLVPKDLLFIKLACLKEYFKNIKSFLQRTSEQQMGSNKENEQLKSVRKKHQKAQKQSFTVSLLIICFRNS